MATGSRTKKMQDVSTYLGTKTIRLCIVILDENQ